MGCDPDDPSTDKPRNYPAAGFNVFLWNTGRDGNDACPLDKLKGETFLLVCHGYLPKYILFMDTVSELLLKTS
jgi:hypothetical protein